MDEKYLELAEHASRAEIEAGIESSRKRIQVRPTDFVGECGCGERVPPKRIKAGYYNCVDCQAAKETRGKLFVKQ